MNNRSGIILFFIFLFLAAIILLQILGMIQSDRLFERVNRLESVVKSARLNTAMESKPSAEGESAGDEGDWLGWCLGGEPATLNPITNTDIAGRDVLFGSLGNGCIFESLLDMDPDTLKWRPRLAASYEVSADGLELIFVLRDGIHFSDGQPVTADDIIFSYQTLMNPGVDAASQANYYINVREVVKLDDRRVKFVMKEPYFKSLEIAGTLPIVPRHVYAFKDPNEFNRRRSDPVGSGPYIFEKWDVGREIVIRRNERYWGIKPALNKIVFKIITNDLAALQALRAHEIDLVDATSEQFVTLSKNDEFSKQFECLSYWTPMGGFTYIGWNMDTPFFNDKRVRLAMTHMIDRESIRLHIGKGLSRIMAGPFYILGPQSDPNIKPWPFDLAKAKQLLNEVGWKDTDGDGILDKNGTPFKFRIMSLSGAPIVEQIGKLIKDDAAKIGVVIDLDPYEFSVYLQRLHERKFEATFGGWGGVVEEDPYQIWHSSQITGGGSNYIGFRNAEVDKLLEQARRTLDESKRNELYHRFAEILHEEQPYTFMFSRPQLRFLDKRFHNVKIHKIGIDELEWYVPKDLQRYK